MAGALLSDPEERVEDITRPEIDGHCFRRLGKRGAAVQVTTEVDTANATTALAAYRALIGTLVSVVRSDGATVTQVLVQDVTGVNTKKLTGAAGGVHGGNWLLTAQWTLLPTAV
jgi:hypothetical protein